MRSREPKNWFRRRDAERTEKIGKGLPLSLCSSVASVVQAFDLLRALRVSAVKSSSRPGRDPQCQRCTVSMKPRESRPDAYASAFHPAAESARLRPADTRMGLALPKAASQLREELS